MGRWKDDARGRLAAAAFELFTTQGFEATTGAQIAAAAGMHERSFFRHFPDKRDALFVGWDDVSSQLHDDALGASTDTTPLGVLREALGTRCDFMAQNHAFVRARDAVLSTNPALLERDLSKNEELSSALARALTERGTDDVTARLVSTVAVIAFRDAVTGWARQACPETGLRETFEDRLRLLGAIFT